MDKKLPILYYRPGRIVDTSIENWFDSNPYTINDLVSEVRDLELNDLFSFLIEIISIDRVNIDVIKEVIGPFEKVSDSVLHCCSPNNINILQCTISYTNENDFQKVESLNFNFRDKVLLQGNTQEEYVNIISKKISEKLISSIVYPLFIFRGGSYTNQLLIKYN